jgi:hypothetical protein
MKLSNKESAVKIPSHSRRLLRLFRPFIFGEILFVSTLPAITHAQITLVL